ncbi:glycosyltransferase [Crocinitomicaceae bacterium]|nr:glycosyltransferase [Crocinitomicaceae bacterium]MDC0257820.1 glycosyltransferase [Crocinitomicaceae bacterium]
MKKVLILSYFYPPSVFVGGQRTAFWAKELHRFGYYPIIVTRVWNKAQTDLTDAIQDNELRVEKFDHYEVHYLPYKRTLRDKIANKQGFKYFQKALTLWELIMSNYSTSVIPYNNMLKYCDTLLSKEDIPAVIASGRPFQSFYFGYKLRQKHDIKWIPDYRDEWNSHYREQSQGTLQKFIQKLETKSEKKWTSNADHFVSVSQLWVDRISALTNTNGSVVKNGFDAIYEKTKRSDTDLKVLYAGTLYPYQDISMITDSIASINDPRLKFYFIGSCYAEESRLQLEALSEKHPENFQILNKVPKSEFEKLISEMDIGILSSYKYTDGWLPVKIYDYYAHGLEILLCPSDNDLMAQFIQDTESGAIVENQLACESYLKDRLKSKSDGTFDAPRNYKLGKEYHRLYQTEMLAKTLDSLVK